MRWVELKKDTDRGKRGDRIRIPAFAGNALVMSNSAAWVQGPHKKPLVSSTHDRAVKGGDPTSAAIVESKDRALPTVEEFADLSMSDKRDLMRELDLQNDADLRKADQMLIVYSAYASEHGL